MPTISHSELAPDEAVTYSLGMAEFRLDGRTKSYETNDQDVIANANAHPWLTVTYPEVKVVEGSFADQLAPADDVLSATNSIANDPAEIAKALAPEQDESHVAIQAGLDQGENVTVGDTDVTVAAAAEGDAPAKRKTTTSKES
jgi:hypothetical protein